ncbi:MAG: hypothetical protein AAGM40_02320, partial [Cyanobacteria bacterium J06573_2]
NNMINNNQNPREYDAVLGGNNPPPIDGVVLGGIEGLKRRLETGNTQQRVDSLADAVRYGDAGVGLLINALEDSEIQVRAKAFEILKNQDSEKVQEIVDKGIPLKKGDKLYCVYASDIDYNDEFYNILDSFEKAENSYHTRECHLIYPIARYAYKNQAKAVAEDFHQTILRGAKISDFFRQYNLNLTQRDIIHIEAMFYYSGKCIYEFDDYQELANISNLNNFCIENNIPLELKAAQDDEWHLKKRLLNYLYSNKMYEQLSNFLEFMQIGKFAFVEEEIINKPGYLK